MIIGCVRSKRRQPGGGKLYSCFDHGAYNVTITIRSKREGKPQQACDCFHLGYVRIQLIRH